MGTPTHPMPWPEPRFADLDRRARLLAACAALEPISGEARARHLHGRSALDEAAIAEALGAGDRAFVIEALALLGGLPQETVSKAVTMGSAKGVTSVAWQAGLGMRMAVQLQLRLARIPPPKVLQARDGIAYPLSEDDMRWQIEFFGG